MNKNMGQPVVVVAHPAQQHSFKTAEAVTRAGAAMTYFTTVYDRPRSLTRLGKRFLQGQDFERAETRSSTALRDADVQQIFELGGLVLLLLRRIDKTKMLVRVWGNLVLAVFNRRLVAYVIKNRPDVIILYDALSLAALRGIKRKVPHTRCVLDMSAPAAPYVSAILNEESQRNVSRRGQLQLQLDSVDGKKFVRQCAEEIALADAYLSASEFTTRSLIASGVSMDRIHECRYGVDISAARDRADDPGQLLSRPLRFIYVGRIIDQKGVAYLLEAFAELDAGEVALELLGQYSPDDSFYQDNNHRYTFRGHVTKREVASRLSASDVLIFPSLADGFGLAVVEALACGVPVICSENAGVSAIVQNEVNGFVVPAGDAQAIRDKALWFCSNRHRIPELGKNAIESVRALTWRQYDQSIEVAIGEIMKLPKWQSPQGGIADNTGRPAPDRNH